LLENFNTFELVYQYAPQEQSSFIYCVGF
jgi:hypothetical protein